MKFINYSVVMIIWVGMVYAKPHHKPAVVQVVANRIQESPIHYPQLSRWRNLGERPSKIYVCTAADEQFFKYVKNFIASVQHHNFNDLGEIAVFDLGFTSEQREELSRIEKVRVYDIERTNPDILT
ncbi:MAG: hypothetical protein ACHQVS_04555, partial [Candidatus Babeliales bacterium]